MIGLKLIAWSALDTKVLVVLAEKRHGPLCAYIGACEGKNHDHEADAVMKWGSKLDVTLALAVFPGRRKLINKRGYEM